MREAGLAGGIVKRRQKRWGEDGGVMKEKARDMVKHVSYL